METSEERPNDVAATGPQGKPAGAPVKEVRVEIRTNCERIEGFIKIPQEAQSYCKRLSDILWYADRGGTGILTIANAFVYDLKTSKLVTRQNLLGVSKSQVVYFWLLPEEQYQQKPIVLELTEKS